MSFRVGWTFSPRPVVRLVAVAGVALLETSCGSDSAGSTPGTGGFAGSHRAGAAGSSRAGAANDPASGGDVGAGGTGAGGFIAGTGGSVPVGGGRGGSAGSAKSCGDGKATDLEPCDGLDLRGVTCADLGFDGGVLRCDPSFCHFDVSGCTMATSPQQVCGNGIIETGETCDGPNVGGKHCEDLGGISGSLSCGPGCTLSTAGCQPAYCGDGLAGSGESCDKDDLRGMDCKKLGYAGGILQCKKDACVLDDSKCERCGDGRIESGEACDGKLFGQATCRSLGFSGGKLACTADCKLDKGGCASCGNGTIESGENCDGAELGGATCGSLGLAAGTLACSSNCLFDLSGCDSVTGPRCGNGIAESGEECDGEDLTRLDCLAFGKDGGKLACSTSCRFDTSHCTEPAPVDPCQDCRDQACAGPRDACEADLNCLEVLDCMRHCDASTDDFCWFNCAGATPASATGARNALGTFACVTTVCGAECGGAL